LDRPFGHFRLGSMSVMAAVEGKVVVVASTAKLVGALTNLRKSELEVIVIEDWNGDAMLNAGTGDMVQ
jgi:hypothetical protein